MCKKRDYQDWWTAEFNCSSSASDPCWEEQIGESASLYLGGIFLGCAFGAVYCYIWAVGILASGMSAFFYLLLQCPIYQARLVP